MLPVTGQEEKMTVKEEELRKVTEAFDRSKGEVQELERKYAQIIEEKSILAEQLQAETEMCAEAEEVRQIPLRREIFQWRHFFSFIFNNQIFNMVICFEIKDQIWQLNIGK